MRPKNIVSLMLLLFVLPAAAMASPDEASGTVIGVVDGKTFDVRIEKIDPRIIQSVERVTLADVEIPNESMNKSISEGPSAKDLAVAILLNKTVWLDIDNRSEGGQDPEGYLVAILYLAGLDGGPVISPSFNRMLVDYGIAELNDSDANEFDPKDWWPPQENISGENVSVGEDTGTKTTGLNIDINPTKPNVDVNISRLNININPTKPKVNVNLSSLNINVTPTKPVIDVNPTQPNATENETSGALSSNETMPAANYSSTLPFANFSEPVILRNSTVPITLVNPTGSITVINSTGEVTVIDPARPVRVINSTELETMEKLTETDPGTNSTAFATLANINGTKPETNSTETTTVENLTEAEAGTNSTEQ